MTDKEKLDKLVAEIERRYDKIITLPIGKDEQWEAIKGAKAATLHSLLSFIDSMQEEPISEDFEEEFERAWLDYLETKPFRYSYDKDRLKEIAHRFANWQKSQPQLEKLVNTSYENGYKQCKKDMVKNAVSGHIGQTVNGILRVLSDEVDDELGFKAGDKVKLIIIKKD